jgi:hypothetical protein
MDSQHVSHYTHRPNSDGSFDSICHGCFATVASVINESELAQHEHTHVCNPFWSHQSDERHPAPKDSRGPQLAKQSREFAEAVLDWWDTHAHIQTRRSWTS